MYVCSVFGLYCFVNKNDIPRKIIKRTYLLYLLTMAKYNRFLPDGTIVWRCASKRCLCDTCRADQKEITRRKDIERYKKKRIAEGKTYTPKPPPSSSPRRQNEPSVYSLMLQSQNRLEALAKEKQTLLHEDLRVQPSHPDPCVQF